MLTIFIIQKLASIYELHWIKQIQGYYSQISALNCKLATCNAIIFLLENGNLTLVLQKSTWDSCGTAQELNKIIDAFNV